MERTRFKTDKAEVYTFDNFLSDEECDRLREIIDEEAKPSTVVGGGKGKNMGKPRRSGYRTSDSASLHHRKHPEIKALDIKMSEALGVPIELGEVTQGQRYDIGQEFKDHTDYFGEAKMKASKGPVSRWGDRWWTFVVYLNDDCEGGETDFPRLGHKFKPKKGLAAAWKGIDESGKYNPNTLHAGLPVIKGKKYIITKWFRQHPTKVYPVSEYFKSNHSHMFYKEHEKPINMKKSTEITKFDSWEDIPQFTEVGFELRDLPPDIWKVISDTYQKLKPRIKPETFRGQMKIVYNDDRTESPIDIINLGYDKAAKKKIHNMLLPILKKWSGRNDISPIMMYGIRSYKTGAMLAAHRDRLKTHHVSCIVIVDEDNESGTPWELDIQAWDGTWHQVVAKPGQFILYESATRMHARSKPFQGKFFRNMFIHYKLDGWELTPGKEA